jgi:large subunit ribosomal protein L15
VGRGPASGQGKTACRGQKGQHSRSGSKRRAWFEGGQMPLQRRLPKYGFYSYDKLYYQIVNLRDLNKITDAKEVTPEILASNGLVKSADRPIKILGSGKIEKKMSVKVHAISKSAREQVEKLGGEVTLL